MSDADLHAIIAYLRSDAEPVQADPTQHPSAQPSFLTKALCNFVFESLPMPENTIETPPISNKVAYGKYLATGVLDCYNCHSEDFTSNDILDPEQSPGFFGGGMQMLSKEGDTITIPNIALHATHGIGNWTLEQFDQAIRYGWRPGQQALSSLMPRYTGLSEEEVAAIWAYLQTVPTLDHNVAAID